MTTYKKPINVVAAIIKKDNQYLITQRNKNKHMGLRWEFPGGKVNENENFEEALKREIKEELNIRINIYEKIAEEEYKDDPGSLRDEITQYWGEIEDIADSTRLEISLNGKKYKPIKELKESNPHFLKENYDRIFRSLK